MGVGPQGQTQAWWQVPLSIELSQWFLNKHVNPHITNLPMVFLKTHLYIYLHIV